MSAGVFRQEDGQILTAKVGRSREGVSLTRLETGALSLALSDTKDRNKALMSVGDSKALLTTVAGWVGEGKSKSLAQCPGDILREVVVHHSVERGVATILIKSKPDSTRIRPCAGTVLAGVRFLSGRKRKMGRRCRHAWGKR
jgi:hypothetical protein